MTLTPHRSRSDPSPPSTNRGTKSRPSIPPFHPSQLLPRLDELLNRTTDPAKFPGFYNWATTNHPGKPFILAEWGVHENSVDPTSKPKILGMGGGGRSASLYQSLGTKPRRQPDFRAPAAPALRLRETGMVLTCLVQVRFITGKR